MENIVCVECGDLDVEKNGGGRRHVGRSCSLKVPAR